MALLRFVIWVYRISGVVRVAPSLLHQLFDQSRILTVRSLPRWSWLITHDNQLTWTSYLTLGIFILFLNFIYLLEICMLNSLQYLFYTTVSLRLQSSTQEWTWNKLLRLIAWGQTVVMLVYVARNSIIWWTCWQAPTLWCHQRWSRWCFWFFGVQYLVDLIHDVKWLVFLPCRLRLFLYDVQLILLSVYVRTWNIFGKLWTPLDLVNVILHDDSIFITSNWFRQKRFITVTIKYLKELSFYLLPFIIMIYLPMEFV